MHFNNFLYNKYIFSIFHPIYVNFYRYFIVPIFYPHIKKKLSVLKIHSRLGTANVLLHSNKSLGRFGDGEIQWLLGNKRGSFEKNSELLSKRLINVIESNDKNFMVALPDAFRSLNQFNLRAKKLWGKFVVKYYKRILPYLNSNIQYYNTSVVRPYIDYNNKEYAQIIFNKLKHLWENKRILIVEGRETRLGVGNNLFNNSKIIKRIECPVINAFESYNKIFNEVIEFLRANKTREYMILISLGPTATILAYDLFKLHYRAIDVGHIDSEYSWFLHNAKKPVNIPYKYTNESKIKIPTVKIDNMKYYEEIIKIIK